MKNTNVDTPEYLSYPHQGVVDSVLERLLHNGAEAVHHEFSVALPDQRDVIYEEKRLLITPEASVDEKAKSIKPLPGLYVPTAYQEAPKYKGVILHELPRNGRTLLQVAVSSGNTSVSNHKIFGEFGTLLKGLSEASGLVPDPKSFDLKSVMYLKVEDMFVLNPATEFVSANPAQKDKLSTSVYEQLIPRYEAHGAAKMMNAYLEGLS